jgi:HEPN domain-containing protein
MRESEERARLARRWREKADEDFKMAVVLGKQHDPTLAAGICFHVQQAVEKYLKAYLVLHGTDFRKTHNIAELMDLLPSRSAPDLLRDDQDRLSEYAVVTRYPGEYDNITIPEADEALDIGRRVRRFYRKKLAEESA